MNGRLLPAVRIGHILHKGNNGPLSDYFCGCGNVIMGDDGFGPGVVEQLNSSCILPENVEAVDAGTGVREYLFDFLLTEEGRPEMIILLDAVDFPDRDPGAFFRLSPADIPAQKIHDFSLHQFPTVNLLLELEQYTGVRVIILAAQIEYIPEEIAPGLSPAMSAAVDQACAEIFTSFPKNAREVIHL